MLANKELSRKDFITSINIKRALNQISNGDLQIAKDYLYLALKNLHS